MNLHEIATLMIVYLVVCALLLFVASKMLS